MRLVSGLVVAAVGVAALILSSFGSMVWLGGAALTVAGAFQIFEGWSGWCIVRAMGFRTRI